MCGVCSWGQYRCVDFSLCRLIRAEASGKGGFVKNPLRGFSHSRVSGNLREIVAAAFISGVKQDRVDAMLVARGLCDSREQAKRLILAGEVRSGDRVIDKPGMRLAQDAALEVMEKPRYVGRGGLKLEGALQGFGIDPSGWTCLDVGASTGGFTDCLLQHGAAKVHAIDVGTNQLVWKLREDPRVVVREKFNARYLTEADLGERVRFVVMDLSFISLTKVLPAVYAVLEQGGQIVCLIKPQFELEKEQISKGGIVRDPELHERAVRKIRDFCEEDLAADWLAVMPSPITGMDGNQEFLARIAKPS